MARAPTGVGVPTANVSLGRRRVERTDHRFLDNLTSIQADEVAFVRTPPGTAYPSESKQESAVEKLCLATMVRKKKMYD